MRTTIWRPSAQRSVCILQVHDVGVPYWFLPDEGGTMTPATYEEMADTSDMYLKVGARGAC